jgi:hypothetical protein
LHTLFFRAYFNSNRRMSWEGEQDVQKTKIFKKAAAPLLYETKIKSAIQADFITINDFTIIKNNSFTNDCRYYFISCFLNFIYCSVAKIKQSHEGFLLNVTLFFVFLDDMLSELHFRFKFDLCSL